MKMMRLGLKHKRIFADMAVNPDRSASLTRKSTDLDLHRAISTAKSAGRTDQFKTKRRRTYEFRGHLSEWIACALLVAKGYRILARRVRTPNGGAAGEIDLIAKRGKQLRFVEVKQRRTHNAALASISLHQLERIENAVERWLWRHPQHRKLEISIDAIVLNNWLLPRHLKRALHHW